MNPNSHHVDRGDAVNLAHDLRSGGRTNARGIACLVDAVMSMDAPLTRYETTGGTNG